jgi:predicted flavoprotein YhiN
MKTSPVLRAWLRRLDAAGVAFKLRHRWTGWDDAGALAFATPDGAVTAKADATVLALGGASWPQLGSSGAWVDVLSAAGVRIVPLQPANCGFLAPWSEIFRSRFGGAPRLAFVRPARRGEALLTKTGLEGQHLRTITRSHCRRGRPSCTSTCPRGTNARWRSASPPRAENSRCRHLRKTASLTAAIGLLHEATIAASSAFRHVAVCARRSHQGGAGA